MENIGELKTYIEKEISTAKKQESAHKRLEISAVLSVIILGGVTTVLAAVNYDNPFLLAILAASTTVVGILEKTFNFKKNAHAYRITKTDFQNLKIDAIAKNSGEFEKLIERLKEIKSQKAIRTTA